MLHSIIEIGQFRNIEEMLKVSSTWIDKNLNNLRKEVEEKTQERINMRGREDKALSISDEEYKLLLMMDALCERRNYGTQTVGETIQIALELFDVKGT